MTYVAFLQSLLQRSSDSKQPCPTSRTPSALELPELLEIILAFVDHETLMNTTRLVCRSWYAISKRFLRRELVFEWPTVLGPPPPPVPQSLVRAIWQKGTDAFNPPVYPRQRGYGPLLEELVDLDPVWLSKLARATALRVVRKKIDLFYPENRGVSRAIHEALEALGQQNQPFCRRRGLEGLWIDRKSEQVDMDYLWPLLPSATLTSLRIEVSAVSSCVALEELMEWLPNLNDLLHYSTSGVPFLSSLGGPPTSDSTQNPANGPLLKVLKSTKLQSVTFVNVPILEDDLRELVERSPQLKELSFTHVDIISLQRWTPRKSRSFYWNTTAQDRLRQWTRFLADYPHVRELMSLRLSARPQYGTIDDFTAPLNSKSNEFQIDSEASLLESLVKELMGLSVEQEASNSEVGLSLPPPPTFYPIINHLTALTLSMHSTRVDSMGKALHRFLCSAPALKHLCAKRFRFAVEDLDVYGQHYTETKAKEAEMESGSHSMMSSSSAAASLHPGSFAVSKIWACRGLQTLHLSFYSRSGTSKKTSMTSFEDPVNARILFGYLSRVTPLILDLSVSIGASSFGLEYGFYLLSRLRHLEVLVMWLLCVQFKSPQQPSDLAWISVGGLSAERESEDKQQRATYLASAHGTDNQGHRNDNMSIVGSMEDVNLALDEIKAQDQVATVNKRWPGLRGVSIRCRPRDSFESIEVVTELPGVDKDNNACRNETQY